MFLFVYLFIKWNGTDRVDSVQGDPEVPQRNYFPTNESICRGGLRAHVNTIYIYAYFLFAHFLFIYINIFFRCGFLCAGMVLTSTPLTTKIVSVAFYYLLILILFYDTEQICHFQLRVLTMETVPLPIPSECLVFSWRSFST